MFKNHPVLPSCHGPGHLPLDQVTSGPLSTSSWTLFPRFFPVAVSLSRQFSSCFTMIRRSFLTHTGLLPSMPIFLHVGMKSSCALELLPVPSCPCILGGISPVQLTSCPKIAEKQPGLEFNPRKTDFPSFPTGDRQTPQIKKLYCSRDLVLQVVQRI